jgi:ATP-binding cassette subfamily B protein
LAISCRRHDDDSGDLAGNCSVHSGRYFASVAAAGIAHDLRSDVFQKVETLIQVPNLTSFSTASLITRTTNDITQIQRVMVLMIGWSLRAILGVGGVIKALSKSTSMSWIIGVAVICCWARSLSCSIW